MLNGYLNQTAQLEKVLSGDEYNNKSYGPAITIKCRKQAKTQLVRQANKEDITAHQVIYTDVEIKEGYKIDNIIVLEVHSMTGLSGETEGYKVIL